jgi:AcrR family transcriptional regulator
LGRPREHDQKTRLALLSAAERQIAAGGPAAVSVRSVAAEAGTTTRAVYALFGSKEGLLQALAVRAFELLSDHVEGVPVTDDPLHDLLSAGVVGYRSFALEHPNLFRLVLGTTFSSFAFGPEASAAGAVSFAQLVAKVQRAQAAGFMTGRDPNLVTLQIYAAGQGMAGLELCGMIDAAVAENLWNEMFRTLVRGLERRSNRPEAIAL